MMTLLLLITFISWTFVFIIYGLYFFLVLKTNKKEEYVRLIDRILEDPLSSEDFPNVSILVPAYNEEAVIFKKLQNVAALNYPREKIEVLIIDDCSTDGTRKVAEKALKRLGLQGTVLTNKKRMGPGACYNKGFEQAKHDLMLMTDADVTIEKDALKSGVKVLMRLEHVGGVTAKTGILSDKSSVATRLERTYRKFWDSSLTAESALYSTFPGGCAYTLLRKHLFTPISVNKGSNDGNISLSMVKKGFRYIYVPQIVFYETISQRLTEQRRQKVRRSIRLIQSTLMNKDILFNIRYHEFGKIIFPLRFAILLICPLLIFVGLLLVLVVAFYFSHILSILMICVFFLYLFLGMKTNVSALNTPASFLVHQAYLLLGLIFSWRRTNIWTKRQKNNSR
jgi:cellulose synthase/poly-beta-1,6-N-acetylglucosamine synthase-like glycosyltransferase